MSNENNQNSKAEKADLVVIGGVGYDSVANASKMIIETEFGQVSATEFMIQGEQEPAKRSAEGSSNGSRIYRVIVIPRHQGNVHIPPTNVNYKAQIKAAATFGAPIISINSVGTMKGHKSGTFFIPDDFIDMTKCRDYTYYHTESVHVDMSDPYCRTIRKLIREVLTEKNYPFDEGVYIATEGSRFETKAEIRMYATFSDVVGMTSVPEVILAKELGICYASICVITNPACGLDNANATVTVEDITDGVEESQKKIPGIIAALLPKLEHKEKCGCADAPIIGRI